MSKRRGNNEGSIYQDNNGRWRAAVHAGYKNGRRRRKLLTGKTRAEVATKLTAVLRSHQLGAPIAPERQTLGQYLTQWLEHSVKLDVQPRTFVSYEQLVRVHLVPVLGAIPLGKLNAQQVGGFLKDKRVSLCRECQGQWLPRIESENCPQCGSAKLLNRGVSARTAQYLHAVLRRALNQALRWDLVGRNVATLVDAPHVPSRTCTPYTPEEARRFLEAVSGDRLEAIYTVAIAIGLRQGEALGLRWSDVDMDCCVLNVSSQLQKINRKLVLVPPKRDSRRRIDLPDVLVSALRAHRTRQENEKRLAGSRWRETDLVFSSTIGTPIDQRNLLRHYGKMVRIAGLRRIRFHDLRHTCASLLLAQGVSFKAIQEILGHSDIRITMNLYAHLYPDAKREAAQKMNEILTPMASKLASSKDSKQVN